TPADHPENTLASFQSAIDAGCDLVECDVHLTADGELAVIHDHLLERTTNGTGLVGAHTLAELRELDAGKGQRIPLLEEVIELVRDRVGLVIETKQNPVPYPGLEEKLAAFIRERGMADRVSVISFHHRCIRHLREVAPELDLGIIDASRPIDPVGMLRAAGADLFSCYWGTLDPQMVEEIRAAQGAVGVWTVDDQLSAMWARACHPDSVFSNRPAEIGPLLN
ncbi:MAG TPA: glycerophosphodiester phosphodiesterase family protein, partial [Solirubrobacterales bacterium]|nr:glycerophosphodiester phosphodiesterase family protein [Solirubrobacterales bacterium]